MMVHSQQFCEGGFGPMTCRTSLNGLCPMFLKCLLAESAATQKKRKRCDTTQGRSANGSDAGALMPHNIALLNMRRPGAVCLPLQARR
jgi:hypothetical protein